MHQATNLEGLDKKCDSRTITAYIGFDCTADSLHVGSLVQIMMLRQLQNTGHKPIVLMGGGTTKIGDPSGKDSTRKILDNKIVGITCHNSKKLIKKAINDKADYIAIGAFFSSKTKKVKFKADIKLLKYAKKITKIPIIVIGGIKLNNYKNVL